MKSATVAVLAVLALIVLSLCTFVVGEGQSVLVTFLGEVSRPPISTPGLYFRLPFFQEVLRFDTRILSWDGDPERIPVKDSKFIFVDTFARWRITDLQRFYNAVRDERGAQSRLDDVLDGSVRDVVSIHYLLELVRTTGRPLDEIVDRLSSGAPMATTVEEDLPTATTLVEFDPTVTGKRLEVRQRIFDLSSKKLRELDLGIELVDLRIKRIDYTDQVEQEVFRRMISEQLRIAERYRAQGQGKKAEIAGLTQQEQQRIDSESYRTAQQTIGEAEAESTRIYAQAYNRDPEFYRFFKSLETYRQILGADDTLLLSTDSDLLRYLKTQR